MQRHMVVFGVLLATASCEATAPRLPRLEPGQVVEGRLAAGETRIYAVSPTSDLRLLFRAASGSIADTLEARIVDEAGADVALAVSAGTDTSLAQRATPWLLWVRGEKWRLHIRQRGGTDGRFAVQLFPRSDLPERADRRLTVGQTVATESIDVGEDVDEFAVSGNAGDEWIVFAQARQFMQVRLIDSAGATTVADFGVHSYATALEHHSSGRVILPRSGTYLLRASGDLPTAYALRLYKVDRAPETAAPGTTIGAIVGETINDVGDIDEFSFSASAGQEINFLVQRQSGMEAGISFHLLGPSGVLRSVEGVAIATSLDEHGSGRFALPTTGTYTVRVMGQPSGSTTESTGQYRFELYPVDRRPESAVTLSLDGPPISAAIDRPGDIDEYSLDASAGQLAVVRFEAVGATGTGGHLMAELIDASGSVQATAVSGGPGTPGLPQRYGMTYSYRVQLTSTGTYTIRVGGVFAESLTKGGYTLEVYTVSAAPEHVPSVIQLGDTITGERIDRPGDLDVFTIAGVPGRQVNAFLGWATEVNGELFAHFDGDMSQVFVSATSPAIDAQSTGRFTMAARTYIWTVDSHWSAQRHMTRSAGSYAFRMFRIDSVPETRASAYAIGDTVSGEVLYPAGDIDVYTFELASSTVLRTFWEAEREPIGPTALLHDSAGSIVWGPGMTFNGEPVHEITLPAGQYRVVVLNWNVRIFSDPFAFRRATLPYRFALVRP